MTDLKKPTDLSEDQNQSSIQPSEEDIIKVDEGAQNIIRNQVEITSSHEKNSGDISVLTDELFKDKLHSVGVGPFEKDIEYLFSDKLDKTRKSNYHETGLYYKFNVIDVFENKDLGISIGLYSEDDYVKGQENNMNYSNGLFIKRSNGTYSKGPERRWRMGDGNINQKHHILSLKNIKIENNNIIVEVELGDGSLDSINVGPFILPPVYKVYRNNYTYAGEFQNTRSNLGKWNNMIPSEDGILPQGSDIVENDFIRSIPDDAIVITDNAAVSALPSLTNKKIINIDKDVVFDMSGEVEIGFCAKEINKNPSEIMIFQPSCADHGGNGNDETYAREIRDGLKKVFPNSNVVITKDLNDLNKEDVDIKVVDRHKIGKGSSGLQTQADSKTLILPLSENGSWYSIGRNQIDPLVQMRFDNKFREIYSIDVDKKIESDLVNRKRDRREGYQYLSADQKLRQIENDLENAGYLSDLDGEKLSVLDVTEYDKTTIFQKLRQNGLRTDVVEHLYYETPKAKNLKIVMLKIDPNKHGEITEENFIEEMKRFGVRPIKYEEYLQFVLNNSEYLKDGRGRIYMPEKVTSSEHYKGFIQSHSNGLGISTGSIYYCKFPFVIEE